MTALRQFSLVYVVAAWAYAVAMTLSAHPVWQKNTEIAAVYLEHQGYSASVAVNRQVLRPGWRLVEAAADDVGRRVADAVVPGHHAGRTSGARMARAAPAQKVAQNVPVRHRVSKRHEPERAVAFNSASAPHAPRPSLTLIPSAPPSQPAEADALPPNAPPASAADIIRVTQRLRDNLTSEMLANFELFLYVSKADAGPWAQRMYVFQKQSSGDLKLLYNWPVSTGREKIEFNPAGRRVVTETPPGYYELDPRRSYAHYDSAEWGKPMPYAMFFNWVKEGNQTGLAIHAADGDDEKLIGKRASAGCIHLTQADARTLFTLIRTQYRGLAPRFAIDRRTGTMSNEGILMHDAEGHVKLAEGYKVLIFIENFGGENVVAALF